MGKWLVIFIAICVFPTAVNAQHKIKRLTDQNIEDFIYEMTDLTQDLKNGYDEKYVKEYLFEHLHQNAYFRSTIKYVIPGYPAQENSLSLDRQDYIDSLSDGQHVMQNYQADIDIQKIRISTDRRKATVTLSSRESGKMNIRTQGLNELVPMQGNSTCLQILMLSDQNILQVYSANCSTELSFEATY